MTHKIAIVEDDELIRNMIRVRLEESGFKVRGFSTAEALDWPSSRDIYDLIILDIVLPGMPGDEFLKQLRGKNDNTPVLMLTVKNEILTRVQTLDSGADDYMAKPFNMYELLARVRALIRRSQGKRRLPSSRILVINGYRIDSETRICESRRGETSLSEKEIRFLTFLVKHPRECLSRTDILEEVWGMDVAPTPRTVDNFIMKFRKLFEDNPEEPRHFISVRSLGYRFEA